ncbi:Type 1 glutamine amidotransferase-like domain-containing protein, partial [Salmonella enterica subsp. enterica serovar Typhimurium]|nr:Type 1 glutamine amidotransferase-like domain-containing protein [Salmonella enterica subsp. enterica serovar Typhimurium]
MAGNGKLFGVLALQGDFEKHQLALERAGARQCEVRTLEQLNSVDALVIPGGESTTMLRLMDYYDLFEPMRAFGQTKPVFGTCAGAILMARGVSS